MTTPNGCSQNIDPLKLVREGTSQDQRFPDALDPDKKDNPDYPRVDERKTEHAMVFARAYSKYLQFYSPDNTVADSWEAFFSQDVSVQLAVAAVQDVDYYKANIKVSFDFLKNHENKDKEAELKNHLGYLFSTIGTLAKQLDQLKEELPTEIALKHTLRNLIQKQLAPAFGRLIAYYKASLILSDSACLIADALPDIVLLRNEVLLGETTAIFSNVYSDNFSKDWITNQATDWNAYIASISPDSSVYGSSTNVFERINHIATHNLFTSIFDQFLKVFARTVLEAKTALESTFTNWDHHEPHYALFLSFLRLFDYARDEANTLTQRHLDFYYKEVLKLKEKPVAPGQAHLLVELTKQSVTHEFKKGDLFKAGKDDLGKEVFYAADRDFVANIAKVTERRTVYRHGDEVVGIKNGTTAPTSKHNGRIYASPVAVSGDGMGAKLTTADQSWHPFFNKIYQDGDLVDIKMPKAEVGFAIASHYLWMAEGARIITVNFNVIAPDGFPENSSVIFAENLVCLLTSEKGWIEKGKENGEIEIVITNNSLQLIINLTGADAAVTPYNGKTHGNNFTTNLPILLVKLRHSDSSEFLYNILQNVVIKKIDLKVNVTGLKTLVVSNDFGPIDTSKPFQPFGASPQVNSALVIGSKEVFQKNLETASIKLEWQSIPQPFSAKTVNIEIQYLQAGNWEPSDINTANIDLKTMPSPFPLSAGLDKPVLNAPDFSDPEIFNSSSRHGFVRIKITKDFGQSDYEQALIDYIKKVIDGTVTTTDKKPIPPAGPFLTELTLNYTANQPIILNSADKSGFDKRQSCFLHVAPFGHAEQHPYLKTGIPDTETNIADNSIYLLPQFKHLNIKDNKLSRGAVVKHEAELYIGVTGLKPPPNLALLFQFADGSADPRLPNPLIHWSYLVNNEWVSFAENEVEDLTKGLLISGIVTFAMPSNASDANTLLPNGKHWIRVAVASGSSAVCRLLKVAEQALKATYSENDTAENKITSSFQAKVLAEGTISKLEQPNAEVKKITQPFPSFGGRGAELPKEFYNRISERLRHKDRGIALWDYERLILEAFPQIYKAKCLNHTRYEPDAPGKRIYNELAPGHVTIVTIPDQQFHNLRDPLKPFTSLGLLAQIDAFLTKRLSRFVILHVKNPLFEEVRVKFKVKFYESLDEIFYENKLNQAITSFLSPWAFAGDKRPSFGGKIYKSVLMNFVEELPYVDYITDFQLFHDFDGKQGILDKDEVEGSTAISILVSAKKHMINDKIPGDA